ncbi:outer membrane beta-barrel family protein [Chitinophaga sp. 212800010-3]|uniref:outer membrane beta-barrel family protein n=1 Tax=unclassified Chitinophaga TaxID=2619133 RepID=UPI002DED4203|nr:OMP-b-brl-3 domain-containing protein [Chitinophaga sp. 212800010-3]
MQPLYSIPLLCCLFQSVYAQVPVRPMSDTPAIRPPANRRLNEVVIQATKPVFRQQPYGTIVNVGSSVLTRGSSALEVLERSPGVFIDRRNNSIALNGKSGVTVMLNGKQVRMPVEQLVTFLNGLRADNIEKIELLTTPPAGYDAEGSAGMINIVLKRNRQHGTSGTASATAGYGWGEKAVLSLSLAHNTPRAQVYGDYSFSHDRSNMDWHSDATDNVPLMGPAVSYFLSTMRPVQRNHNAGAGVELHPDSTVTLGASLRYNNSLLNFMTMNKARYHILPDSLVLLDATINGPNRWRNVMGSLYLEKRLRRGTQLSADLDYLRYINDNPSDVQTTLVNTNGKVVRENDSLFAHQQKGMAHTVINVGVVKMDYIRQFNPVWKLEAGIKGTYTQSRSVSGIISLVNGQWVSREETSNNIAMKEAIGAAYVSLNAQLNPLTSLVIGARYEYSLTRMGDRFKNESVANRKLGKLFPSIFLSRKLNEQSELQFSFTERISRPSYNDLASFVAYTDPVSVFTGNPLLKPAITYNLKLGYRYKSYAFSLLGSRDNSPIVHYQIVEVPGSNLLHVSPQNLAWQNNIALQADLPWKVGNWWNMNYSLAGGWRQFRVEFTRVPAEKAYYWYTINFNETFQLPQHFSLEVSGWYNGPSYDGSKKYDGFGAVNAGIKKEMKNNSGTLQLSVTDVFRTNQSHSYYGALTEEAFSLRSHVVFNTESHYSPIFKLTYARSFGGNATKNQRIRQTGASEERERVRSN